jgi:DeoR/GlpR family transcriptional regulator of sugar metabolism
VLADRRHDEIVRLLAQRGSLSLQDIVDELTVSEATARRDIDRLAEAGRLTRVYGGALANTPAEVPFAFSDSTDRKEKRQIAKAAVALVHDGDTVVLDIGSTVLEVARLLAGRPITVVTNNLMVYEVIKESPTDLVLLGGAVRRNYWATSGPIAAASMRQLHANVAFIGTSGITRAGDVLDTTPIEVVAKQALIRGSDRAVLLATERKFPGSGSSVVCGPESISTLVTSARTAEDAVAAFTAAGVDVIRAP